MRLFIRHPELILLAVILNYAVNFLIVRWVYRDEGGFEAHVEKDGKLWVTLELLFFWEVAVFVFAVGGIIMAIFVAISYLARPKRPAEKDDGGCFCDHGAPDEAYTGDPDYPVTPIAKEGGVLK